MGGCDAPRPCAYPRRVQDDTRRRLRGDNREARAIEGITLTGAKDVIDEAAFLSDPNFAAVDPDRSGFAVEQRQRFSGCERRDGDGAEPARSGFLHVAHDAHLVDSTSGVNALLIRCICAVVQNSARMSANRFS